MEWCTAVYRGLRELQRHSFHDWCLQYCGDRSLRPPGLGERPPLGKRRDKPAHQTAAVYIAHIHNIHMATEKIEGTLRHCYISHKDYSVLYSYRKRTDMIPVRAIGTASVRQTWPTERRRIKRLYLGTCHAADTKGRLHMTQPTLGLGSCDTETGFENGSYWREN